MPKSTKPAKLGDKTKEQTDGSLKDTISTGIWIYKQMFRLSFIDSFLYITLGIIAALMPTAVSYFIARFIDELVLLTQDNLTSLSDINLGTPIVIFFLGVSISELIRRLSRLTIQHLDFRFETYHFRILERELRTKTAMLDVQQYEDPDTWDNIRQGLDHIWKILNFWQVSAQTIARTISIIVAAAISFGISPPVALLILLLAIPNNIIYGTYAKKIRDFYNDKKNIEDRRKTWGLFGDLSSEKKIPEYTVTQSHNRVIRILEKIHNRLVLDEIRILTNRYRSYLATYSINFIGDVVSLLFLASQVILGNISIGSFTFFRSQFQTFSGDIDYILGQVIRLNDSAKLGIFVRKLLEMDRVVVSGNVKVPDGLPPAIEFKNVSFKYPRTNKYVLKDINVKIDPGEEIAIVGENGAGKTTLIKLLLRFYDPTKGKILINGTPLDQIDLKSYYKTIGTLFQEFNVYGTQDIETNISLGDVTVRPSKKRVKKAAANADAHSFIKELKHGYKQILAPLYSRGTNLSTGQKQKIALARMFYRDSPVLIFDEPTASIDAEAEYKIFKRIYKIFEKKTVIIISHRFSTVRNAQKIYVLRRGKITESGSHEELLGKKDGAYAKAFKLQAEGYQTK